MITDPKAQKRFENDQIKAQQGTMLSSAAKLSLPLKSQRVERGNRVEQLLQESSASQQSQQQAPTQIPTRGAPMASRVTIGMSPSNPDGVNEIAQSLQNDLDLDMFLGSPQVQQSLARSKLRQYFASRNNPSGANFDIATDALANLLQ